ASSPTLGVTGFIQQWAQVGGTRFITVNPTDILFAGIEANLDIQYTVGVATGVPVTFLSVGLDNSDGVSGFLDVYEQLTASDNPPP
ncbi:hypothetical protein MPER_15631, partial [Moniliophthora perniciosa FA553]